MTLAISPCDCQAIQRTMIVMNPITAPPPDTVFLRLMAVEVPATATPQADAAERRVPCICSTETPVLRVNADGSQYTEVLLHREPGNVDLSRAPLPLLIAHDPTNPAIGVVDNLRLENHELRGDLLLGSSDRASELWADICAGVVRTVSVGYRIQAWRQTHRNGTVLMQATRWTPHEVSLVGVPADPAALIEPPRPGTSRPTPMNPTETPAADPATATADEVRAIRNERTRVQEIERFASHHAPSLPNARAMVSAAIADGIDPTAFRHRVLNALVEQDRARGGHFNHIPMEHHMPLSTPITITHRRSHADSEFEQAATDGLLLRAGVARAADLHPGAVDFRGQSLVELAGLCLSRAGIRVDSHSPMKIVRAAMSNSDLPSLLSNAMNKALRTGLEAGSDGHRNWVKVSEASNFKPQSRLLLGSAPELLPVGELAEYTQGSMSEDSATLVPQKFGRIVAASWEALVNDDLGAFLGVAPSLGRSAARAEADAIYDLLLANSGAGVTMQDSVTLFHATHANVATAATGTGKPLTAAALSAVRAKLRRQIGIGGALLNLTPRSIIVPPERETEAEMLIASGTIHLGNAAAQASTPGWLGMMQVIADPRLEDVDTLYVVASPEEIDCAELAILDGHPVMEEEDSFNSDARRWKLRHVFGAGFLDHRGIVKLTLST